MQALILLMDAFMGAFTVGSPQLNKIRKTLYDRITNTEYELKAAEE